MCGAILSGLLQPDAHVAHPIIVTTRSEESAGKLAREGEQHAPGAVVALAAARDAAANRVAVREADLVLLGVKPWQAVDMAREVATDLRPGAVVVSVAAGVTTASLEAVLPDSVAVVRAMPNTPARVMRGVTGIAGGSRATTDQINAVAQLFEHVGAVLVVHESQIDDVTAISGSGPAYLFYFTEMFEQAARRRGFNAADAQLLARETVIGAAELLAQSDQTATELRRRVTSPQGTTERAVQVLQDADWGTAFDRALAANVERSAELAAE